jgi:hypothetical protein
MGAGLLQVTIIKFFLALFTVLGKTTSKNVLEMLGWLKDHDASSEKLCKNMQI